MNQTNPKQRLAWVPCDEGWNINKRNGNKSFEKRQKYFDELNEKNERNLKNTTRRKKSPWRSNVECLNGEVWNQKRLGKNQINHDETKAKNRRTGAANGVIKHWKSNAPKLNRILGI